MDQTDIQLGGAGPFRLPLIDTATAEMGPANGVTMTLYCGSKDRDAATKQVSAQMSPSTARDLAIFLWLAADQAEFGTKTPRR